MRRKHGRGKPALRCECLRAALWHDNAGKVTMWLDGSPIGSSVIATIYTGWAIGGIGDFDGDGKADILWHDIGRKSQLLTNEVIWFMNGSTVSSFQEVGI